MNLLKYLRVQWDRAGAVLAAVVGVVLLIAGYHGVSGTQYIAEQIPYVISFGFGTIVLFTVAAVLWISADLRDEWRELVRQGDQVAEEIVDRRTDLQSWLQAEVARQVNSQISGSAG
ncbi:MAG TPA: hypothetical protein VHU88_00930 [Sporichthyaceae bacterium]|jgi:hypothetical protein|nr:hypothetical protein [Sporichthyaceae bacterium]